MTFSERDEVFQTLRELLDQCPDMRLGQLILNLSYMARGVSSEAPYDVEDAELLAVAKKMIATLQATHAPVG